VAALEQHYELLTKWNARMNLTAIRNLEDAVRRHYAECLWFAAELRRYCETVLRNYQPSVVDIGSGAGLPGLALAIARPDLELHLVEPLSRRTGWLSGVAAQLELDNVVIHTARAESMWDRLSAPWVTARAVSGIVQLAQWTLPLLSPRGSLLALKGSRAAGELAEHRAALRRLGAVQADVESIGEGIVTDPTIVLRVTIGDAIDRRLFRTLASGSAGSARRRTDRPRAGRSSGSSPRDHRRRAR